MHREGYHSKNAIECELAWMKSLCEECGVITPAAIPGIDGELIQIHGIEGLKQPRHLALFEFIESIEPNENQDLIKRFENLGEASAKLHLHILDWQQLDNLERLIWNFEHMLGSMRTGVIWGCEKYGVEPDLLATVKAITGGMYPISAQIQSAHSQKRLYASNN